MANPLPPSTGYGWCMTPFQRPKYYTTFFTRCRKTRVNQYVSFFSSYPFKNNIHHKKRVQKNFSFQNITYVYVVPLKQYPQACFLQLHKLTYTWFGVEQLLQLNSSWLYLVDGGHQIGNRRLVWFPRVLWKKVVTIFRIFFKEKTITPESRYNKPRYNKFHDLRNKSQLPQ